MRLEDMAMKARVVRPAGKHRVERIETSEIILSQIADLDLFLARDIRKLLESGPSILPPTIIAPAYIPTRTSLTTS